MKKITYKYLLLAIIALLGGACDKEKGNFQIRDHAFYLNGKSVQLICGEMHYPRIPQEYWRDRIRRAKAMGINTISTYVFWNIHERQPGVFDFEGQADLGKFVKIAQEEGLYVILRPGPYVCAEWDFGGYPAWLQQNEDMVYRSRDPKFLNACERYINRLGKEVGDLTISNGGPILMVQVAPQQRKAKQRKILISNENRDFLFSPKTQKSAVRDRLWWSKRWSKRVFQISPP